MNKIIELDNVIFEDHTGVDYFEELVKYFKEHELEILNFFRLDKYDKKWKIFLLNYPEFYDYIKRKHESSNIDISFKSGDSSSDIKEIRLLSLEDANKYSNKIPKNLDDLKHTVMHEFIHSAHSEANMDHFKLVWLSEGLATNLSGENRYRVVSLDKLNYEEFKDCMYRIKYSYYYAYTIVKYMIENYSYDEVYNYIMDSDLLRNDTDKIFDEANEWAKVKKLEIKNTNN